MPEESAAPCDGRRPVASNAHAEVVSPQRQSSARTWADRSARIVVGQVAFDPTSSVSAECTDAFSSTHFQSPDGPKAADS